MEKTKTSNINKETFLTIKGLRKGRVLTKVEHFLNIQKDNYVFCMYQTKLSSIFKKEYSFGLCYIFKLVHKGKIANIKNTTLKPVVILANEVPIMNDEFKSIKLSQLNIEGCSFNEITQKHYDQIMKIVLVNGIVSNNGKKTP
jgi:hypothetical protein